MQIDRGAAACAAFVSAGVSTSAPLLLLGEVSTAAALLGIGVTCGFAAWLAHVMLTSPKVPGQ